MTESSAFRFALIVGVALTAHLATLAVRAISQRLLLTRIRSEAKVRTVTGFSTSVIVFVVYFGAFGFVLSELGISLTTYLASASVIGLAVSFGSQGVVQDVITGLTVVFSDLLDVGDMVDLGGQVGIVESVGMRFTVLVNFSGARVYVPNRSISNVINHPKGYIRAYMDVRLPADPGRHAEIEGRLADLARSAYEQYPGILLVPPTLEGSASVRAGYRFARIKFRIWPGQGAVLERAVSAGVVNEMKQIDSDFADWMVQVHYRSEPRLHTSTRRLPRPAALRASDVGAAFDERASDDAR